MKQKILLILLTVSTVLPFLGIRLTSVQAQGSTTATPSASEVTPASDKSKQIEELKERIATKVAELSQMQRRAVFGTVKSVSIATATIETKTKDIKIELTDDIKVIQVLKGKRTTLTTDNLAKGDIVTVFGNYDVTLDILRAKVIFIQAPLPQHVSGLVTALDKSAYTVTIKNAEGLTYTIDIETATKTNLWDGQSMGKGGFSKIQVGDTIHVTGTAEKQENRISADRILDLLPLGSATRPTPTVVPATPSPTPKASPTP